jgi:hypothetical protein
VTAATTTSTRSIWLAAYFVAADLEFIRAARLAGPAFRVAFFFRDPQGDAPRLTKEFLEDARMQRLISARRALAEALDVARDRHVCEAADIGDVLATVGVPWAGR